MDLREFLFRKNISMRELAEVLGCNYQTVCKWKRGEHCPNIEMAKRLIEFSKGDITLDEIYGKRIGLSATKANL